MAVKTQDEIGGDEKGEETTPEVKPETTPQPEEVITLSPKELRDKINAGRAEIGRSLKVALTSQSALQQSYDEQRKVNTEFQKQLTEIRQRERDRELKGAEGTDLVDAIKLKHQTEDEWEKLKQARSDYERERSQHQVELDEVAKFKGEQKANELAKESGLTADLILQIGTDTADNGRVTYNLKRMEAIAKSITKEEEGEGEEEGTEQSIKGQRPLASGAGSRSHGRGLQTMEDYDKAYNEGRISTSEYAKARERLGVAY